MEDFAPPLARLGESGIGVTPAPAGGKGLALTALGKLPDGVIDLPYTFFELNSTGYGAAPDLNFRFFTNGSLKTDRFNPSSWIVNAAIGLFAFPKAGFYLVSIGKRFANQDAGSAAVFLLDSAGTFIDQLAARETLFAGSDPSANVPRSGFTAGPTILQVTAGAQYKFGGYWGGSSNFSVWFTAIRLPL